MNRNVKLIEYTYGPEWGKELEGMKLTFAHNPLFDGPIEMYENKKDYKIL